MDWAAPIDAYCERLGAGLLAEPLNAVSNLAFFVAAAIGWRAARNGRSLRAGWAATLFAALVAVIGLGSLLFHTFANRWSSLADVLPIAVFIHGYFGVALHRFAGSPPGFAVAGTLLFALASFLVVPALAPLLGSSAGYAPALLALYGLGGWLLFQRVAAGRRLLAAGLVFTLSLCFRMADETFCAAMPAGTHFAWHILNAATLTILVQALARGGTTMPTGKVRPS